MEIEPEVAGASGVDHLADFALQFVCRDGRPSQEPDAPGLGCSDHPVSIADPAHGGLHNRVAATEAFGQWRLQPAVHWLLSSACLLARAIPLASKPPSLSPDNSSLWA